MIKDVRDGLPEVEKVVKLWDIAGKTDRVDEMKRVLATAEVTQAEVWMIQCFRVLSDQPMKLKRELRKHKNALKADLWESVHPLIRGATDDKIDLAGGAEGKGKA